MGRSFHRNAGRQARICSRSRFGKASPGRTAADQRLRFLFCAYSQLNAFRRFLEDLLQTPFASRDGEQGHHPTAKPAEPCDGERLSCTVAASGPVTSPCALSTHPKLLGPPSPASALFPVTHGLPENSTIFPLA